MNKKKILILISFCLLFGILFPEVSHASLETSLSKTDWSYSSTSLGNRNCDCGHFFFYWKSKC